MRNKKMRNKYKLTKLFTALMLALLCGSGAGGQNNAPSIPQLRFQNSFFGEMPRVFCTLVRIDPKARTVTIKRDNDGKLVTVPIRDDTELHFRDWWGELSDYFPGEHIMLFMYVDDDHNWTYPRAIQDDIHVSARHNWFARVSHIDRAAHTFHTTREEKNAQGLVTKTVKNDVTFAPDAKVWKEETPGNIDTLRDGDEVIQQLVERSGKLVAVEIFTREGDDAVRNMQVKKHHQNQERFGLPATVNDVEPLSGSLLVTVAWSGAERVNSDIRPGDVLTVAPLDGAKPFAAAVQSVQPIDTRQRIQFVVNARIAVRLILGQSLRVFLPTTGPALPTGRAGFPAN